MLSEAMVGVLEAPGVSYRIAGGGDQLATTIAITIKEEAIDSLAARFACAPDMLVIMGEIVDGIRDIFGSEAVSVKQII